MLADARRTATDPRRISTQHTCRCLVRRVICHGLLVLVVDQHLVFGILLHVKHLMLLVALAVMTLRKRTVLLIRLNLLRVLLDLELSSTNTLLSFIDLRRRLAVLLDEHG